MNSFAHLFRLIAFVVLCSQITPNSAQAALYSEINTKHTVTALTASEIHNQDSASQVKRIRGKNHPSKWRISKAAGETTSRQVDEKANTLSTAAFYMHTGSLALILARSLLFDLVSPLALALMFTAFFVSLSLAAYILIAKGNRKSKNKAKVILLITSALISPLLTLLIILCTRVYNKKRRKKEKEKAEKLKNIN